MATPVWMVSLQFFEEAVTSRICKHEYDHMWKNAKVANRISIPYMQNINHKKNTITRQSMAENYNGFYY